jgi:hypothetical protein
MFDYVDGRQITVYVPPDLPEAIVFAGDGQGHLEVGRLLDKVEGTVIFTPMPSSPAVRNRTNGLRNLFLRKENSGITDLRRCKGMAACAIAVPKKGLSAGI